MSLDERRRLEEVYGRDRADPAVRRRRSAEHPGNRRVSEERDSWWASHLRSHLKADGRPLRLLEVGCGPCERMKWSRKELGADALIVGIDLVLEQMAGAEADQGYPVQADATRMPFRDGTFDVVVLSTVLSSIPDGTLRARVAAEIGRVLVKPGEDSGRGLLLFYDMRLPSPTNRSVRPITKREVLRLFPGWDGEISSLTLLPPISRALIPRWPGLAGALSRIELLRSHYVAALSPPTHR